ncbi:MAG: HNH endonuclease [Bacteroidales bacterium]|jgi:5-methylcytosine-specific restriction endonuclease McrA|nr:HNH endonuclease [Bacteroidales bacterium]
MARPNRYTCSDGSTVSKTVLDRKVHEAKAKKLDEFFEIHLYHFCEECGRNKMDNYLDCAHTISVDECQKSGRAELAWDVENIRLLCRKCHQIHDKNFIHNN